MIKLEIIAGDQYGNFILEDSEGKKYKKNINFIGMDNPPVGSIIYLEETFLEMNFSLNYGPIEDEVIEERELMMVELRNTAESSGEKKKYLRMYHG